VDLPTVPQPEVELGDASSQSPSPDRPRSGAAIKARVLLVEDHPDSAEMLSLLLLSAGLDVRVANSVEQALSLADDCDVVVSDIALPDGSGLELLRELHSRRHVPAVAVSGYGSDDDISRSLAAGFSEHLTKPVDFERLIGTVRRLASG
jgi:CheY-like chemotaxis protein